MAKYLLLKHYRGAPAATNDVPMDRCRPEEIDACKGYLREQIRLVAPEVVMTLGNFATKLLLKTEVGITRLRGRPHQWWLGALLVPTFHPAAALRGGDRVTTQMREDFALVRGYHQGYPKKLGSIWMTRPITTGRAGPRLEPGGRFGAWRWPAAPASPAGRWWGPPGRCRGRWRRWPGSTCPCTPSSISRSPSATISTSFPATPR